MYVCSVLKWKKKTKKKKQDKKNLVIKMLNHGLDDYVKLALMNLSGASRIF